ncbi:MAG: IPT/TIG domain-containing protein [Terracidiphilus sp.]
MTTPDGTNLPFGYAGTSYSLAELTGYVTLPADTPSGMAIFTLGLTCDPGADEPCPNGGDDPYIIWQSSISVRIVGCSSPSIASVTPDGWWAGQKQNITISGGCFLPPSDSSSPSQVTLTDGAGAVTLSNVSVVSSTQITATVNVTKKAPAETVTLTVTNTSSNGASQSATASPAPVVLPVPVIKWKGNAISGDKAKNQSVIVGQPVELTTTPASLPGGFTVSGSNWTIPGTNVQQFSHPNSGIVLTPTQTNKPNTTYYWLYPQDAMNVAYTYCATDPNGNQICESPEAKAAFNAKGPGTLTLATDDSQLALVEKLDTCNPPGKLPFLEYGDLSGPAPGCGNDEGPAGIHLTVSGASSGSYVFAQVVDADVSEYTHATGPSPTSCGAHAGLDRSFPYEAVEKQNPQTAYDGPQMPLFPNALTGTRTFHASMYLLWQPDQLPGTATASIPVPIGRQDWQFIATAVENAKGKWERHAILTASGDEGEGFVPSTPDDNAIYGYPQWTHLVSNVCGVSQEVQ